MGVEHRRKHIGIPSCITHSVATNASAVPELHCPLLGRAAGFGGCGAGLLGQARQPAEPELNLLEHLRSQAAQVFSIELTEDGGRRPGADFD